MKLDVLSVSLGVSHCFSLNECLEYSSVVQTEAQLSVNTPSVHKIIQHTKDKNNLNTLEFVSIQCLIILLYKHTVYYSNSSVCWEMFMLCQHMIMV